MNIEKLRGLRILVVEDNYLIATDVRSVLSRLGCVVVGPVASVEDGTRHAEHSELDGAILDINIFGGNSANIAETLKRRGCPFFFLTGYGDTTVFEGILATGTHLRKPVTADTIAENMLEHFVRDGSPPNENTTN